MRSSSLVSATLSGLLAKPGAHHRQRAGDVRQEGAGFRFAALFLVFGQYRHEGLRKGAFGKDAAQQVGQFEGHKEGVGSEAGAEYAGNDGVADKAQHARNQGHAADFCQRF